MNHALVKLGQAIDWGFLEQRFGAVYEEGPGRPPLPTRLMAGLAILKHAHDLSDEALCELWIENPVTLAVERIIPIRTEDSPVPAQRPRNSRLNPHRLQAVFGIKPPDWRRALDPELDQLAEELLSHKLGTWAKLPAGGR